MKLFSFLFLLNVIGIQLNAQVSIPQTQVKIIPMVEKIKISFPQPPTLHDDGGWEKGPSNWFSSSKFPVACRAGLLVLDRKQNGMIRYISVEIRFSESGTLELSATASDRNSLTGNDWQKIFGKKDELKKATFLIKDGDFGTQAAIHLKTFKAYTPTVIH